MRRSWSSGTRSPSATSASGSTTPSASRLRSCSSRPRGRCSAAGPAASSGRFLADGELPAGRAENADPDVDLGVERIPTVCVMELDLEDVPERPRYLLRLPEGRPLEFERAHLSMDEPLQLIVQ